MTYTPKPVDTANIFLGEDLEDLVDYLAKNTHDNWAAMRIMGGWRYGPERNDKRKEHPCLIPYDELPESEKEHDRTVVQEMLKTLIFLGYEVRKGRKRKNHGI